MAIKQQAATAVATRFLYMVVLYMAPKHKRQGPPEQRALGAFYPAQAHRHPLPTRDFRFLAQLLQSHLGYKTGHKNGAL
jgi:hypothetical protein